MLQINPSEYLRIGSLINNSLSVIDEDIQFIQKTDNLSEKKKQILEELKKLSNTMKTDIHFLTKIINEFEEAMDETIDKILTQNHSNLYYKEKLLSHYASILCNNNNSKKLEILELCYQKDEELDQYCQRQYFINNYSSYIKGFNPLDYDISYEELEKELIYIYDTRGPSEAYGVMRALVHNPPKNFFSYNFNPHSIDNSSNNYDFNNKTINNYLTNSEKIVINGQEFEFVQVLPKDCTNIEYLAYNFAKANTINTMRTLPNKYLELCTKGNSNSIILACNNQAMNHSGNWSGYYKASSLFNQNTNMIVVNAHGSFNNNEYYTQDTIIHEMAHKFDDMSYSKNIIDKLFGKINYTSASNDWQTAFDKYHNILNSINDSGYQTYPNVNEFFSDATIAYFKDPNSLKTLCPEVYSLINKMLDGEQTDSYDNKIKEILKVNA